MKRLLLAIAIVTLALGIAHPAVGSHNCGASIQINVNNLPLPPCHFVPFAGVKVPDPDCSKPFVPPLWACYMKPRPDAVPSPVTIGVGGNGVMDWHDLGDRVQLFAKPGKVLVMSALLWE